MEFLLIGGLIVFFLFGYPALQDWRENQIAKRLEEMRKQGQGDPNSAAGMVDSAIIQSQVDADRMGRFRDHRF